MVVVVVTCTLHKVYVQREELVRTLRLVSCGESFELSNALVIYFTCTEKQSPRNYKYKTTDFLKP